MTRHPVDEVDDDAVLAGGQRNGVGPAFARLGGSLWLSTRTTKAKAPSDPMLIGTRFPAATYRWMSASSPRSASPVSESWMLAKGSGAQSACMPASVERV